MGLIPALHFGELWGILFAFALGVRRDATSGSGEPPQADAKREGQDGPSNAGQRESMLDAVSLVHMNGRVYDPKIGRFLSADPIIQTIELSQALNPFSYVMNNPLSLVDPSGYSWLSKLFHSIGHFLKKWGGTIISVAFAVIGMPYVGALLSSAFNLAVNGGTLGSFFTGLAISAIAGAIAGPIGGKLAWLVGATGSSIGARIVAGAITGAIAGGINSEANGQSFWSGFAVGAVTGGLTAGLQAKFGGHELDPGSRSARAESWARGTVGKVWNLPNTIVGLLYGGVGHVVGEIGYRLGLYSSNPSVSIRNNSITFTNNPFMSTAMTIGNVAIYGNNPRYQPGT
ncbi:MAG: RHS repeat-associated core domain-containing protein [Steroidobacteraceae bacterium]